MINSNRNIKELILKKKTNKDQGYLHFHFWREANTQLFTCSKSTIKTLEKCVKYVQS